MKSFVFAFFALDRGHVPQEVIFTAGFSKDATYTSIQAAIDAGSARRDDSY
jgi:hypothetical protein